jgi:hypothetical protein
VWTAKFRYFVRVGQDLQGAEIRRPWSRVHDCDHNAGRTCIIKTTRKFTENHHHHGHHYQPQGRSHPGLLYLHECCFLHLFLLRPTFVLQIGMYVYRKYCRFQALEEYSSKSNLLSSRTYGMYSVIEFRSLVLSNPYL